MDFFSLIDLVNCGHNFFCTAFGKALGETFSEHWFLVQRREQHVYPFAATFCSTNRVRVNSHVTNINEIVLVRFLPSTPYALSSENGKTEIQRKSSLQRTTPTCSISTSSSPERVAPPLFKSPQNRTRRPNPSSAEEKLPRWSSTPPRRHPSPWSLPPRPPCLLKIQIQKSLTLVLAQPAAPAAHVLHGRDRVVTAVLR